MMKGRRETPFLSSRVRSPYTKQPHKLPRLPFKHVNPIGGSFQRSSVPVQTGLFLEQLTEAIPLDDFATQTDDFLDRPPTPLFVPAKTGRDTETQIYEGDLFDFDLEVRPILEVLVGKTIEQALIEVLEEEELADLRRQKHLFEEIYNADLAEVARLEEQNRRYR
ncbi:unnamed protein product [Protopolystoma xenopodis]|uniref:Uncharacterized protein n=1 Tax=Protopolystoma xenopodis TaxID=117903 RepID=A0A3S5B5B6_9PLAT|nr:unnamed protein product [Protopolystoma xenopodis]